VTTAVSGGQRSLGWLVLPALLFFTAFGIVPLLAVLALSFTSWDGLGAIEAAGFANWTSVLADPGLPHALWVTFLIMALSWLVQTPLSILIGTFLARGHRYRAFLAVL
jgi:raffinose/stachyose/melibiose transport system permease protein